MSLYCLIALLRTRTRPLKECFKVFSIAWIFFFIALRCAYAEDYVKLTKVRLEENSFLTVDIKTNRGDYTKPGYGITWCVFEDENYFESYGFGMGADGKMVNKAWFAYGIFLEPTWNSQSIHGVERKSEFLSRAMAKRMVAIFTWSV